MLKDFRVTDSLGLKDFRVKGIWRSHDLGVKPSSACCELRMLQCDRVQWITAADTPSCGQKRHTRWPATNSKCWCAIMRSEKTHTLACNECFGMQWITGPQWIPSADVPSCGQKRHTRWPATNASACNELLARNEFQVLMCHHAVRKDTHAGLQRILRHAMNYGCGSAIVTWIQASKHKNITI